MASALIIDSIEYYYHCDHLGSVVAFSDGTGLIVERYRYDVYGRPDTLESIVGNPYMFTGRRYDPETALYYYRARIYNPHIGRFMQTDPIGYADGMNWYTYCANNPIHLLDPFGLCSSSLSAWEPSWREKVDMFLDDLGINWGATKYYYNNASTKVHGFLDVVGTIEPTPFADITNATLYGLEGKKVSALASIGGVAPYVGDGPKLVSRISDHPGLVRQAKKAGKSVQEGIDKLTKQLSRGNMNPGIGTRSIEGAKGVVEARARDGARVYFRNTGDTVEILGKSNKANQGTVIEMIKESQ